ncbi:MAG: hypothetical protein CM15mP120_19950 [Pseudomonadota bacterium]|nr:MAG: hypothetical protein CM15mP120_19950 [Pseudomonadota bacterium]
MTQNETKPLWQKTWVFAWRQSGVLAANPWPPNPGPFKTKKNCPANASAQDS